MKTLMGQGEDILDELFASGKLMTFRKGDIIVRGDGEDPNGVYHIEQGFVKLYSINGRGEEYIHMVCGKDDIFPVPWLTDLRVTSLYFEPLADTTVRRVQPESISAMTLQSLPLTYALLHRAVKMLIMYMACLDNLEFKYTQERLAYRLLLLTARFGKQNGNGSIVLDVPLSQAGLANSINASRESVSRDMERLMRRGIIAYDHRRILVQDTNKLADLLGGKNGYNFWELQMQNV
jgi:CRP-like cAMP-binding protein